MKILCDTHSHTIASTHAYSTVHDYMRDAQLNGLQLFSLTDHGPSMPDAPHPWHFGNMKIIPRVVNDIAILRAIEANILPAPFANTRDRYVDLPDGMLGYLDFAIASFHEPVFAPGNRRDNTQAMIRAMASGVIQIIGHPGNPNFPVNQDEIVRAAKDCNVLLEINNSSFLLSRNGSEPHCRTLLELIDKHDGHISLGSDAHISLDVGRFDRTLSILDELGFDERRITTKTPARFLAFLATHGKPVAAELAPWLATLPTEP
ncbi:phosphatase [Reinekea sp.]|jgi:putative hydrolase|uniref:phosphatase n=1 Tax=Reinekea sp. TaxID=1970455 RepID=UPI002A81A33C|nr:phosphatase [Reinekea sp.]